MHSPSKTSQAYDNPNFSSTNNMTNGVANGTTDKGKNGLMQNLKVANGDTHIGMIKIYTHRHGKNHT
jgi:hypothetical protein